MRCRFAAAKQTIPWTPDPWRPVFRGYEGLLEELAAHSSDYGGIRRSFVHDRAWGDATELFLAAMAWGWGTVGIGPGRVGRILATPDVHRKIRAIVGAVRQAGAGAGWTALLRDHRIAGLGMAFGTKVLYFAGYHLPHRPRPLIRDARVRACLQILAPGVVPAAGQAVWRKDYECYLDVAELWAADPTWDQDPDVVEYGLFICPGPVFQPGGDDTSDNDGRGSHGSDRRRSMGGAQPQPRTTTAQRDQGTVSGHAGGAAYGWFLLAAETRSFHDASNLRKTGGCHTLLS